MGAFEDKSPYTLPDPSDPEAAAAFRKKWRWEAHEAVLIKANATVADQEYVSDHYGAVNKKGDIEVQMGRGRYAILDRMILDWSFLYNGQKVPVTPVNIRRLPANYSTPILEFIDSLTTAMTEDEQESFLNYANGHIEGSLELMNNSQQKS